MAVSLYEIVILSNGDIALQRASEESEPLIRIGFSEDVIAFLEEAKIDVAKAMIDAGIEYFEQLGSSLLQVEGDDGFRNSSRVIH